jgi:hypothetical protein
MCGNLPHPKSIPPQARDIPNHPLVIVFRLFPKKKLSVLAKRKGILVEDVRPGSCNSSLPFIK